MWCCLCVLVGGWSVIWYIYMHMMGMYEFVPLLIFIHIFSQSVGAMHAYLFACIEIKQKRMHALTKQNTKHGLHAFHIMTRQYTLTCIFIGVLNNGKIVSRALPIAHIDR